LGNVDISIILILPIHEQRYLYLGILGVVSFNNVLQFLVHKSLM
jgi:hypothetical protein